MICAINHVILQNVKELTGVELEKLLWANAHLNNRTGRIQHNIQEVFFSLEDISDYY